MGDFLRRRGASEQAIRYLLLGFEDDAALDYIRDASNHRQLSRIKGGNDLLPRAFASQLSEVIHYGCAIERIAQQAGGVRIAYRRAGMLDQLDADACICTIPFSVLRGIAVTPDWSPAKRKVIDGTYYGPVERITYQVRRRYWESQGLNGFGTSDKNFEVWHPTHGAPGTRGLLQAYVYEAYAAELDRLSDTDRTERAIADMDEVHPGLRDELETVVAKSWANDPWQKGAYIVYRAGDHKWYPDICRPDGRVWFAGEHASAWPGWMQGALTSGIAAARAVDADRG